MGDRSDVTLTSAQQLLECINEAMQDFRKCQLAVVELVDDMKVPQQTGR